MCHVHIVYTLFENLRTATSRAGCTTVCRGIENEALCFIARVTHLSRLPSIRILMADFSRETRDARARGENGQKARETRGTWGEWAVSTRNTGNVGAQINSFVVCNHSARCLLKLPSLLKKCLLFLKRNMRPPYES